MIKLKVFSLVTMLIFSLSSCEIANDDENITPVDQKVQLEKGKVDYGDILQENKKQDQDTHSGN